DVNAYLREHTGGDFSAKDFRTWGGSVHAAGQLAGNPPGASKNETHHQIVAAVKATARRLGNTPAVCRRSYIHPAILQAHEQGRLDLPPEIALSDEAPPDRRLRRAETAVRRFLLRERRRRKSAG